MYRSFGKWFVIAALVVSVGGHWAFLQTIAWTGMIVSYAKENGVSAAVHKTFDGQHPCKLCKFVKSGTETEKKSDAQLDLKKVDLFVGYCPEFYFPQSLQFAGGSVASFEMRLETPPIPPPRSA